MAGSAGRGLQERGGGVQAPRYSLLELVRTITNTLRLGRIIDCDYPNGKVRVQIGEEGDRRAVTRWINWMNRRSAYDRTGDETPELHEQVLLYCPSGRFEQARVLMRLRQDLHPLPSTDPNDSLTFYRILENTNHWTAMERKMMVGDVNPEEKRANFEEPLHTVPPGQKVLNSDVEHAEALEYYYQVYIRPELAAVMEFISLVTQPRGEVNAALVANAMDSGQATSFIEAAVRGDGDSHAFYRSISGDTSYNSDTNPNKPFDRTREQGNAYSHRHTKVVSGGGNAREIIETDTVGGDADSHETVHTPDGKAFKTITIDGAESELIINVRNSAHLRINVGESGQYVDMDGQDVVVNTPNDANVEAGNTINANAGSQINLTAPTVNINASSNLNMTAGATSLSTGSYDITG